MPLRPLPFLLAVWALSASAHAGDTDLDLLPDSWEMARFGNLAASGGGSDDFDGDNRSDFSEYVAGTSPISMHSWFQADSAQLADGQLEVTVPAVSNRHYALQMTSTPADPDSWTVVDGAGPVAVDGPLQLTAAVPAGDPDALFWRVRVSLEPPALSALHVPSGYNYVWGDQFSGASIDPAKWVVASLRDPVSGDLVPGAAGDHLLNSGYAGYVTPEDSYAESGALVLLNQKRHHVGSSPAGNYNFTSGWIMSMHRGFFNRCYVEIRAKFPSGDKVWPAFWMVAEDLVWGPEWDLWEYFGYRPDVGYDQMGNHLMTGPWNNQKWNSAWIRDFDATYDCEAWHIYGFEWTNDRATWSIDGNVVRTLQRSASRVPSQWPDEAMYIILNNGVRSASPDTTTAWPNRVVVDYIEVYQE